ncbi:hypothetical protein C6P46_006733 [Rhodotorula mucilaginosa]|uniref:BAG domain-containing protein n=1 Tax=Rhodotorula mucilaginosa TaxID=5537 RepID=A0A9P6VWH7_RHOMI|nr:hypothetical protein C6P46_006733 [Rhodotorula mucilaginosa]
MAFDPTPLSFHHPLMVDLDLSQHLAAAAAAAAEQRRQEWEYTQHLKHLRQQQQAAAEERRQLVEAYAAATTAAKEFERRLLLEQEQRRRQAQLQAQLEYQHQQEQQQRARRRCQHQTQQEQRAFARRQSTEWRRLSHVLDSLVAPETITRLQHRPLGRTEQDVDEQEERDARIVPVSPAEIFFQLYGEPESHRDSDEAEEEVVLKHKQPSSVTAADPDPEEVDLAAAAFAAAAAEEEEDTTTAAAAEEDASSEAESVDSDMAETAAFTPGDDDAAEARTAALDALTKLAQDFTARRRAFVTPASLSFQPASVSTPSSSSFGRSPTPPLAFESNNTPFLGYEDFLVSLLSRIDAVESHGIGEVKMARKNLVKEVEQELARLDDLKDQAWERLSASSSSSASALSEEEAGSASDAGSDDDEDSDDEDSEMMTSEAAEGLTLDDDEMTAFPSPTDDDICDSDNEEDASEVHGVKIPFAVRPRSSSRVASRPRVHFARHSPDSHRQASPAALSHASAPDEVADILLQAQRLGEQVAQLEETERDQQEMRHPIDSDLYSYADSDSDEVDGGFVVYF